MIDEGWLRSEAERVLLANWREGIRPDGVEYAYTCPSPRRYKHQWHWDSCFHAIAWSHLDPARARAELRTLLRSGDGSGLLPHTVFWGAAPRWRRAPFYATSSLRGDVATATIQTPLIALAWERVAAASAEADPGFATEGLDALRAHYDWLADQRDPDGDGLISILLPDESGLDDSPKYEPVYRHMAHDRPGYFLLVERCRRLRFDGPAIIGSTDTHVEDVLVNVFYALSLRALARLEGDPDGSVYAARAVRCEQALLDRCLDERRALFFDLAGRAERRVEISTWSALAPLALGDALPLELRERIVAEQLLRPERYRAACGIPSVSMDEPSFTPRWDRFRTWRGPSWVNTAWLLCPPLRALGHAERADEIVGSLVAAARRWGFREYYHPLTGRGLAARDFGWSTLLLDLVSGDRAGVGVAHASPGLHP